MIFNIIQLAAGLILCYSNIPQIIKIYKNKSARDVSIKTYISITIGLILSQIYIFNLIFVFNTGYVLLVTNLIGLILALITIYLIQKYKDNI